MDLINKMEQVQQNAQAELQTLKQQALQAQEAYQNKLIELRDNLISQLENELSRVNQAIALLQSELDSVPQQPITPQTSNCPIS